jgi:hypothetical protein
MRKIRKPIALLAALLAALFAPGSIAAAQEAGVDSTTRQSLGNFDSSVFTLGERLDGWWKLPLDKSGSIFEGSAHLGVELSMTSEPEKASNGRATTAKLLGDADRVRLAFVLPAPTTEIKTMNVEAGRLPMRDPTGLIVSHPADGALLGIEYPFMKFSLQGGFTTLILRNANGITLSQYDKTASDDSKKILGTSRLLVLGQVEIPDVWKQSVNLSFLAQQDLNKDSNFISEWTTDKYAGTAAKGGKVDTQYSTVKVSGPVVDKLFYDAWFTWGSGRTLSWKSDSDSPSGYSYQYVPITSCMTGVSLDWFYPAWLSSAFNFRLIYASGDSDWTSGVEGNTSGNSTQFLPVTATPLGSVFSPPLSNLVVTELGGSVKPLAKERLQTGMKLFAFFRPAAAPLDVNGLKPGESSSWLGFETDVYGVYRMTSDLGLSLNAGLFFPGVSPNGAFDSGDPAVRYFEQLAIVLGM